MLVGKAGSCVYGSASHGITFALLGSRRGLLVQWGRITALAADFLEFQAGIADSQNAIAAQQGVAFTYDEHLLAVGKKCALGSSIRNRAIAVIFHVRRQRGRRWSWVCLNNWRGSELWLGFGRGRRG